eukprot:scaffold31431_cov101-Isochrysis_galbana.AAC.3
MSRWAAGGTAWQKRRNGSGLWRPPRHELPAMLHKHTGWQHGKSPAGGGATATAARPAGGRQPCAVARGHARPATSCAGRVGLRT